MIVQMSSSIHPHKDNRITDPISPPSYSSRPGPSETDAAPVYTFPTAFNIGDTTTEFPLVTATQLKAHRIPSLKVLTSLGDEFATYLDAPDALTGLLSGPSRGQIKSWVKKTSSPFDPFVAAVAVTHKEITCPHCRFVVKHEFMNAHGTGYLQQSFRVKCSACKHRLSKDVLGVHKFAQNVVRVEERRYAYFAGTVYSNANEPTDVRRAKSIKNNICLAPELARPKDASDVDWELAILRNRKGSVQELQKLLRRRMPGLRGERLSTRILSAYTDDRPFSIDLIGAVLRQGSFVKKMYDLKWTEVSFFESDEDGLALQHAIARYHAFLDLMATSPLFLVPTLDIDLAWHTHQLNATKYAADCLKYVKRYIDHDDKVEENTLATSFDMTCRAWKTRFGIPYTHRGCPLPGETIGQKLSRLVKSYKETALTALPPPKGEFLAGTHPSDHNAVFAFQHKATGENNRKVRQYKIASRKQREEKAALKHGGISADERRRRDEHDAAFLVPVPYWYYTPVIGCMTVSAGVFNTGSCGGGFGGCSLGGLSGAGACTACGTGGGDGGGGGGCGGGGGGGGCGG